MNEKNATIICSVTGATKTFHGGSHGDYSIDLCGSGFEARLDFKGWAGRFEHGDRVLELAEMLAQESAVHRNVRLTISFDEPTPARP